MGVLKHTPTLTEGGKTVFEKKSLFDNAFAGSRERGVPVAARLYIHVDKYDHEHLVLELSAKDYRRVLGEKIWAEKRSKILHQYIYWRK